MEYEERKFNLISVRALPIGRASCSWNGLLGLKEAAQAERAFRGAVVKGIHIDIVGRTALVDL